MNGAVDDFHYFDRAHGADEIAVQASSATRVLAISDAENGVWAGLTGVPDSHPAGKQCVDYESVNKKYWEDDVAGNQKCSAPHVAVQPGYAAKTKSFSVAVWFSLDASVAGTSYYLPILGN